MTLHIGSLFSGYGGLEMGVQAVLGGDVVWHVENDPAPSKILAYHWPDVPNYGDVTMVDWSHVEPVDVLTGGFPCQDVSLAGARAGLRDGTRSGLWSEYARAIDALHPSLVVIENVRGLLSARTMEEVDETDSDLEWGPSGVGVPAGLDRPVLNAFGRVLGDLAELGYVGRWIGVRAADAGAPHGRFRVFIVAYPEGSLRPNEPSRRDRDQLEERPIAGAGRGTHGGQDSEGVRDRRRDADGLAATAAYPHGERREWIWRARGRWAGSSHRDLVSADAEGGRSGASAADADSAGCIEHGWPVAVPAQHASAEYRGDAAADAERKRGERRGGYADVAGTPRTGEGREDQRQRDGDAVVDSGATAWGEYEPAIRRWERVMGRAAPAPTLPDGRDGGHRLSALAVEWMMGLPAGHVTDPAIGLTRSQQLKALGNGVVPQQAALALSLLLSSMEVRA